MIATEFWDVSTEEYHADRDHESHHRLKLFRQSIPKYKDAYVDYEETPKATAPMEFGTAFHTFVLEPEKFEGVVAVAPDVDRRTKAGKAEHEEFLLGSEGKVWLKASEAKMIGDMAQSVTHNPAAKELLYQPGKVEQGAHCVHEETGIWIKCLCDKLLENGTIVELKSASEPSPGGFSRAATNFEYHCQAALYKHIIAKVLGVQVQHIIIAVGTVPPHWCYVYELDEESVELGAKKNDEALVELKDCRELDLWEERFTGRVNQLSMPRYAFSRSVAY